MTSLVLCSWCSPEVTILDAFESEDGQPSHGICDLHTEILLDEIRQDATVRQLEDAAVASIRESLMVEAREESRAGGVLICYMLAACASALTAGASMLAFMWWA
jgi:hypothetical protein